MQKIFTSLLGTVIFLTGCSNFLIKNNFTSNTTNIENKNLGLLINCNNYIATESEMESALHSILERLISTNNRSIKNENNFLLKRILKDDYISNTTKNISRSIQVASSTSIPLYIYQISNPYTNLNGYAITSTDRRIGLVLSIVEKENFNAYNTSDTYLLEKISDYIDATISKWNILQNQKFGSNINKSAYTLYEENSDCYFDEFYYQSGNLQYVLTTKWNQDSPFNDTINSIKNDGHSYPAGCGPIAMAQILTTIRPFSRCSIKDYSDVEYDWKEMVTPNAAYGRAIGQFYNSNIKHQVSVLLYEIGKFMNAKYTPDGTSISDGAACTFLDYYNIPYVFSGYDFNSIKKSIDNGRPIFVEGADEKYTKTKKILGITIYKETSYEGHCFIIDGYANFTCNVTKDNKEDEITADFVHINLGWTSYRLDGFYLSGIFDTNNTPYSDLDYLSRSTSTTHETASGYYKWDIHCIYNIGIPIEEEHEYE